jgi:adenylate kinase
MYVILLGAPGAGKGTQAKVLSEKLGIAHVSSGDLLRDNIKRGTALGIEAKGYMDRGELVPDNTVINMIAQHLATPVCEKGAMLDGFPRTIPQADALSKALVDGFQKELSAVLYIKVESEELLRRLSGRWICRVCQTPYHEITNPPKVTGVCDFDGGELYQREDDTRATAEHRLQVYFNQTMPLIEYYRNRNLLVDINGQQSVELVTEDLLKALSPEGKVGGLTESLVA